ncbi:hypothetical protein [Anaerotruncus rubiinfantis]|uniref:hypothetical protein n=1 Tax=Anaerotruncus rubiinfantis TaxID=1720200 RepID=UPI003D79952B
MASGITPGQRKELEDYLKKHPIDPQYDEEAEYLDGDMPAEQGMARFAKFILDENPE